MNYWIKEGWVLNPNNKVVEGIKRGIERCDGECPCDNPYKGTPDAICPCKGYREEDKCCCGLYVINKDLQEPITKELLSRNGWVEKSGLMVLKTPKVRVSWILSSHELIVGYGLMPEPVETVGHLKAYLKCIGLKEYARFK